MLEVGILYIYMIDIAHDNGNNTQELLNITICVNKTRLNFYIISRTLYKRLFQILEDYMKQNSDFIYEPCEICGSVDCTTADGKSTALSGVYLHHGFGSKSDGEDIKLRVCGKCADGIRGYIELLESGLI